MALEGAKVKCNGKVNFHYGLSRWKFPLSLFLHYLSLAHFSFSLAANVKNRLCGRATKNAKGRGKFSGQFQIFKWFSVSH